MGTIIEQPDVVGGASFHPYAPLLCIYTGQRHFDTDSDVASDSDGMEVDHAMCHKDGSNRDAGMLLNCVSLYRIGRAEDNVDNSH